MQSKNALETNVPTQSWGGGPAGRTTNTPLSLPIPTNEHATDSSQLQHVQNLSQPYQNQLSNHVITSTML